MKVLHTLIANYDITQNPQLSWIDEKGNALGDIKYYFSPSTFAIFTYPGTDASGNYKETILKLGNYHSWINYLDEFLSSDDSFFNGTRIYILDSLPHHLLLSFQTPTLSQINVAALDPAAMNGILPSWEWVLDEGFIIPDINWPLFNQTVYDQGMKQATEIIDQWEDLVEIGHATAPQKALWGQWKAYRAALRVWGSLSPIVGNPPLAPSRTTPADAATPTT